MGVRSLGGLRRVGVVGAVVTVLVSGCTHHSPATSTSASTQSTQETDSVTNRWIDNPSIDLMSPEGTFIRAAVESFRAINIAVVLHDGWEAINQIGYPGFAHAFNNIRPADNFVNSARAGATVAGTDYFEVVELTRDGDMYTVGYCEYNSLVAQRFYSGPYESRGSRVFATGHWLTFGPDPKLAGEQQHSPPSGQKGAARRPTDNVFGTWVITGRDTTTLPQCAKLAPGTPTDWPDPYVRSDPPPTLAPDPGWPDAGSA